MTDNQEQTSIELDAQKECLSDKPLPCPFCNIPAEILFDAVEGDTYGSFLIYHREDKCGLHKFGFYRYKTKEEAINHWNTRAPSKQLTATQQALDSAVEALKKTESFISGQLNQAGGNGTRTIGTNELYRLEILLKSITSQHKGVVMSLKDRVNSVLKLTNDWCQFLEEVEIQAEPMINLIQDLWSEIEILQGKK